MWSIPLSARHRDDILVWHYGKNGQYSAKSGYHIEMESRHNEVSSEGDRASSWWKKLWSCKVPNKVKIHLWCACYNAILARSHLHHRGVLVDHYCSRYGEEAEDTSHALWSYGSVCSIWEDSILWQRLDSVPSTTMPTPKTPWKPPDLGQVKINVDASVNISKSFIGIGLVARDANRVVVLGAMARRMASYFSPFFSECMAVRKESGTPISGSKCYITIPKCPSCCDHFFRGLVLVFHPHKKVYRVVHVSGYDFVVEIFTLGCSENKWKVIPGPFSVPNEQPPDDTFCSSDPLSTNGQLILHWDVDSSQYFISFNIFFQHRNSPRWYLYETKLRLLKKLSGMPTDPNLLPYKRSLVRWKNEQELSA
ncbi:hypothetical protein TIFTF001_009657 [Ficus carica]|uniref:Reverse transcriptase zinc-binding domain-containing protein n=1 Tax=Ficus carica TaxID=3494 RepID=A0AA87ZVP0_FICCA|nr:hypothetical protein TIFTF001_009657 [Ficus carica]